MRKSGVLMHISSLSSPYGIGSMGKEAREFVDFLKKSGQSYWQILPVCPTSYGDSPYQSFSTFAGNPYFIDLELLREEGLLQKEDYVDVDWESTPDKVNYEALYYKRYDILRKAADRFIENPSSEYSDFCDEQKEWIYDYALFMALKDANGGVAWTEWDEDLKKRNPKALEDAKTKYSKEIEFWKIMQFLFFKQWKSLRQYANDRGIEIIGDLPIYVALDSVDVWANPHLFLLDENLEPIDVAGCPPDGFSATGQLWGNPLFRWDVMEEEDYDWWVRRISQACKIYNVLRIDHFRGFDSYYAIPYGADTAMNGEWRIGPGIKLFKAMERKIGPQNIIAEDLGYLTDSVRQLLKDSGFPGMKVLEFAFDSRDSNNADYLPHNYPEYCIAYAGTHDNETICGWKKTAAPEDIAYAKDYLKLSDDDFCWDMIDRLWATDANTVIIQAQDILELGSESRMNIPSTLGGNWSWRALEGAFTDEIADRLRKITEQHNRLN